MKSKESVFPVALLFNSKSNTIPSGRFIFVSLNPTNYHVGMNRSDTTLISVIKTTPAQITSITFFNFSSAFTASSILSENIARNMAGTKSHQ